MSQLEKKYTDIKIHQGIWAYFPAFFHPYLKLIRIDRPIGTWLLMLPALWGLLINGVNPFLSWSNARIYLIFISGGFLMRSIGCIINDMADYKYDRLVERTTQRPLASGELHFAQALIAIMALGLPALYLLFLLPFNAQITCLASIILMITYPFLKRFTWFPQVFLGFTFNYGFIVACVTVRGSISLAELIFYTGLIFWTICYDTIYAYQDYEDDQKLGLKSFALFLTRKNAFYLYLCYGACLSFMLIGMILMQPPFYVLFLFILPALHILWQARSFDPLDRPCCLAIFRSNRNFGFILTFILTLPFIIERFFS